MKFNPRYTPVFTPSSKLVDFSSIANFDVRGLLGIYNVNQNALIYGIGIPNLGVSQVSSSKLTLQFDTTAMNAADTLIVIYDDGVGAADASNLYQLIASFASKSSNAALATRPIIAEDLLTQILAELRAINLTLAAGLNISTDDLDAMRSELASERLN